MEINRPKSVFRPVIFTLNSPDEVSYLHAVLDKVTNCKDPDTEIFFEELFSYLESMRSEFTPRTYSGVIHPT